MNTNAAELNSRKPQMRACARLVIAAMVVAASAPAAAEDEWTWSLSPYLWATDVGVDVAISDNNVVDETIAFEDLLDDLERVVQIRGEARRGRYTASRCRIRT